MIIIIINSQGSLTRMHKRILNSDTLQRQWTKLFSYRAVSSGRSRRADLRWRKVSEWHICISKPIKKTLGIPSGYPQAKRGYFALQFSSSVRKEMYKEQCGESVYLKGKYLLFHQLTMLLQECTEKQTQVLNKFLFIILSICISIFDVNSQGKHLK